MALSIHRSRQTLGAETSPSNPVAFPGSREALQAEAARFSGDDARASSRGLQGAVMRRKLASVREQENLPVFPGVQDQRWKSYVAICLTIKEDPDVVEWLEYHKRIGIDVIYMIDHASEKPVIDLVLPYIKSGFVVYSYLATPPPVQRFIYEFCAHTYGNRHRWMGFIDTDEFVVIPSGEQINQVLKRYEEYDGVVLNWRQFGSSGLTKRPAEGVLRSYHRCEKAGNKHVKTFANPARIRAFNSPHYAEYRDNGSAVTTARSPQTGPFSEPPLLDVMYLNHYYLKSLQDWETKVGRTGGGYPPFNTVPMWYDRDKEMNDSCGYLRMPGLEWTPTLLPTPTSTPSLQLQNASQVKPGGCEGGLQLPTLSLVLGGPAPNYMGQGVLLALTGLCCLILLLLKLGLKAQASKAAQSTTGPLLGRESNPSLRAWIAQKNRPVSP